MVLLRRSLLSAPSTPFIMDQLVQLALVSPQSVFIDIINLFALLHRESLTSSRNVEVNESMLNGVKSLFYALICYKQHSINGTKIYMCY